MISIICFLFLYISTSKNMNDTSEAKKIQVFWKKAKTENIKSQNF